jgi:hypothetical protein
MVLLPVNIQILERCRYFLGSASLPLNLLPDSFPRKIMEIFFLPILKPWERKLF